MENLMSEKMIEYKYEEQDYKKAQAFLGEDYKKAQAFLGERSMDSIGEDLGERHFLSMDLQSIKKEMDEYEIKKNIQELINIQKNIQSMSKHNQIEILKIFQKNKNIILNENKYGVFVNLTEINKETIHQLKEFIEYIDTQEKNFIQIENEKNVYKNKFFTH